MTTGRGGPGARARRARSRFREVRRLVAAAALLAACSDPVVPPETAPPAVEPAVPRFVGIAAGDWHFCAITDAGALYCWGSDSHGAVTGRTELVFDSVGVDRPTRPTLPWRPAPRFRQLTAAAERSCGVSEEGGAYCWGVTQLGGEGAVSASRIPGGPWRDLATGASHTCGVAADGTAHCWGKGNTGQLGTGRFVPALDAPARVASTLRFTRIAAGYDHSCALTEEGAAWCWGGNSVAQLGAAAPRDCFTPSSRPVPASCAATPQPVETTARFVSIRAKGTTTCAITAMRETWCWGASYLLPAPRSGPAPVRVDRLGGAPRFASFAVGPAHGCGVAEDGAAWCWGINTSGELGVGYASQPGPSPFLTEPTPVVGGVRFREIAAGFATTCGVDVAGALHCWGSGYLGQLGVGRADPERCGGGRPCSTRPVRVAVPTATGAGAGRG